MGGAVTISSPQSIACFPSSQNLSNKDKRKQFERAKK
jgi:hypothetical protein